MSDEKQLSVTVDNVGKVLFDTDLEINESAELLIKGLMLQILSVANEHSGPKYKAFINSLRIHMENAHRIYHDIHEEDNNESIADINDPFN